MSSRAARILACVAVVMALLWTGGCFNSRGNRREGRPLVNRVAELRKQVGNVVTLVGTARAGAADRPARIDLMDGAVELPEYEWPAKLIDRRVSVTGRIIHGRAAEGGRVYRLGEIESADAWSR